MDSPSPRVYNHLPPQAAPLEWHLLNAVAAAVAAAVAGVTAAFGVAGVSRVVYVAGVARVVGVVVVSAVAWATGDPWEQASEQMYRAGWG